ncbi:MAG: hypothetical protein V5A47_00415 [Bacteroidales bacterium]
MKFSRIYIIVLVLLVAAAGYLFLKDQSSTLDPGSSDFSLGKSEVAGLDSILLSKNTGTVKLYKHHDRWYLNQQLYAQEKNVQQLLNVFQDLRVEAPARKSNRQELLETIRKNPIHVKIYSGGSLVKNFLIEDSPQKKGTSYMMMENSNEPFIMDLPGYDGDLADLVKVDVNYWRDKTLFDYSGLDIERIKVVYPSDMKQSFDLSYVEDEFRLQSLADDQYIEDFNSSRAARYFSYFRNVRFEQVVSDDPHLKDSLMKTTPYCTIEILDENNNRSKLYTYRKKSEGDADPFGQKSSYDLNLLYGRFEDVEEILLIKYTEFDPLLKEIDYFRQNNYSG